jgi:serine/threonine protein kinase
MPSPSADSSARRVEELFDQALDLEPAARAAFLDQACEGDLNLRRRVEQLLASSAAAENNPGWSEPAILKVARTSAEADEPALDRYRLLERIGAGGMGVVYRAVRSDDAFSKEVAIKVVQWAAGDETVLQRFRTERQILANLEHPNIARLLDGGVTADGSPFLVMEIIQGVPIDQYVTERKLSVREILELFRKICSAVSCAHRNLVVHRDLKPANILVTAAGEAKLLDFGIAKLLDGTSQRTITGACALTPEYASPEQIRGEAVTTSTDIYSLGVLLYQLLNGELPYRRTAGTVELAHAICEEPPRPLHNVDADVENILQMALRKEPARRYGSVEQFSEDIRRHLEGYPILARPDTRRYRARKFMRRNKVPVVAAALIALTLIGGIITTTRQARIAERRFSDVRKLANSYLFEFDDAIQNLSGTTPARQLVVKRALEYLDRLASERTNDSSLQRELATAYYKVALIQGMPDHPNLGDGQGALRNLNKSLAMREQLAAGAPSDTDIAMEVAGCHEAIGRILMGEGDLKGAVDHDRKALTIGEALASAHPSDAKFRRFAAGVTASLALVLGNPNYPNLGDTSSALELARKAINITEKLVAEDPGSAENQQRLAERYYQLGQIEQGLNEGNAAVEAFRKALAIHERLLAQHPTDSRDRRNAAMANRSLALAYVQLLRNYTEPQKYADRSVELFGQLARDDPNNVQAKIDLADGYYGQGYILPKQEAARRIEYYDRSIALYEAILREHPGIDPSRLRTPYQLRSDSLIYLDKFDKALADIRKVMEINDRLLKLNPANVSAGQNQGLMFQNLGQIHEKRAEWREARLWYGKEYDLFAAQQNAGKLLPTYRRFLDSSKRAVERCDQALQIF